MCSPSRILKDILLAEILLDRDPPLSLFAMSIVSTNQPVRRAESYYALCLSSKPSSDIRLLPRWQIFLNLICHASLYA